MSSSVEVKVVKQPSWVDKPMDIGKDVQDALDYVGTRMSKRGTGAGERNNQMNLQRDRLSERLNFEVGHNPRHTGLAKLHKSEDMAKQALPQAMRDLNAAIGRKWTS